MTNTVLLLAMTAAFVGFFHTVIGPDHYLPFIVISKARKWRLAKTTGITIVCGIGHVLSSIVIGFIGIALGLAVAHLVKVESFRAEIAAWALIAFGLVYMVWGLRHAWKKKKHTHSHFHVSGIRHKHKHNHTRKHAHLHVYSNKNISAGSRKISNLEDAESSNDSLGEKNRASWKSLTPWVLFTIFVFGPCEPLIPLLMYPAATGSMWEVFVVAVIFSTVTIITMTCIVIAFITGLSKVKTSRLERFSHALAGAAIFFSGLAITLLGL